MKIIRHNRPPTPIMMMSGIQHVTVNNIVVIPNLPKIFLGKKVVVIENFSGWQDVYDLGMLIKLSFHSICVTSIASI
jgi:hypothetical protein